LRFCYYNEDGRFTNRPLTLPPDESLLERTSELVENLGYVARTLQPEEIAELVDILGERHVIELAQLIDTLRESRLAGLGLRRERGFSRHRTSEMFSTSNPLHEQSGSKAQVSFLF